MYVNILRTGWCHVIIEKNHDNWILFEVCYNSISVLQRLARCYLYAGNGGADEQL
jgi:hypothetical protein